jgi:hypothetical protein
MSTVDPSDTATDLTPIIDPVGSDADRDVEMVPDVYEELLSWKSWVKRAWAYPLLAVLAASLGLTGLVSGLVSGWLVVPLIGLMLLCIAVMALLTYREYWRWQHEPYFADPEAGVLFQYQAKNRWLYLLGSDPRTLDLDTADYLPKPQTLWENYLPLRGFRNSCTITVDGPGQHDADHFSDIADFMYGERISAIILYRKSRVEKQLAQDLGFQERQAIAAEKTVDLLTEIRDMLEGSNGTHGRGVM